MTERMTLNIKKYKPNTYFIVRGEVLSNCPFCKPEEMFRFRRFSDKKDSKHCNAGIDFELDEDGKYKWYAVLNGDQYTRGHTLVILGPPKKPPHRQNIFDKNLTEDEMTNLSLGVRQVSRRLKAVLDVDNIHVFSVCIGVKHLHFHLIPEYPLQPNELKWCFDNYWPCDQEKPKYKGINREMYEKLINKNHEEAMGLWYSTFQEITWCKGLQPIDERIFALEELARDLRNPKLSFIDE